MGLLGGGSHCLLVFTPKLSSWVSEGVHGFVRQEASERPEGGQRLRWAESDSRVGVLFGGVGAMLGIGGVLPDLPEVESSLHIPCAEWLFPRYVQLVKALQSMGHIAASDGTQEGQEKERELMDWVQVLVDILGPPRPVKSDDQIEHEQLVLEEEEAVSAKAVSKSGTKSNSGTKSRTGTKLEATSRNGTKQPSSKEPSRLQGSKGPSRTKSHQ